MKFINMCITKNSLITHGYMEICCKNLTMDNVYLMVYWIYTIKKALQIQAKVTHTYIICLHFNVDIDPQTWTIAIDLGFIEALECSCYC